jgi:hypothetical protein
MITYKVSSILWRLENKSFTKLHKVTQSYYNDWYLKTKFYHSTRINILDSEINHKKWLPALSLIVCKKLPHQNT